MQRVERMLSAASTDWPRYLPVTGEIDLSWITAFDAYHDTDRISEIIARSAPEDFSNDYLVTCCEFGAALGHIMRVQQPRLFWLWEWPYWESAIFILKSAM